MIGALPYAAELASTFAKSAPFAVILNVAPATSRVDVPLTYTGTVTSSPGVPLTVPITHAASPSAAGLSSALSLMISFPGTTFESNSTIVPAA